jgi:Flp pilus assembly protein TadD
MKPLLLCAFLIAAGLLEGQTLKEGIAALEAGKFDEAERILAPLVRQNGDSFEVHFYLGLTYFRAGHSALARPLLERAAALSPSNAQAWKMIGLVATSDGDLDRAVTALAKACDLSPKDEEACYYLARNLYAQGRYESARAPFEKALGAAPQAMLGRVHRAAALNFAALGSPAEAEAHFLKAIAISPAPRDAEDPRIDYGAFLFRQGRTEESIRPLQQAAQDSPASGRANLEWGRALLHLDKLAEATARLEKAVSLDPGNSNAHLLLGRAYLRLGRTDDGQREMRLGQQAWEGKH